MNTKENSCCLDTTAFFNVYTKPRKSRKKKNQVDESFQPVRLSKEACSFTVFFRTALEYFASRGPHTLSLAANSASVLMEKDELFCTKVRRAETCSGSVMTFFFTDKVDGVDGDAGFVESSPFVLVSVPALATTAADTDAFGGVEAMRESMVTAVGFLGVFGSVQ